MYDRNYALTKQIPSLSVEATLARVREALAAEGFGVLTEIDVRATLKKKLGIDRKPYVILGACNPALAHRALEAEPPIGLLLPCNVTVFEGNDGTTCVQAIKPELMFEVVSNPELKAIAHEVEGRLRKVVEQL